MIEPSFFEISCPNPKGILPRKASSHTLHYVEWTKNREQTDKVVVCVHGLTRNSRDFDFLAQALAEEGYRVICPDIVGRGKSAWLTNPKWYGYPLYTADILYLMSQLNIERADWIGTSMGGLIGMMIAASNHELIKKMVINDIGPFIPKESLNRIGAYVGEHMTFGNKIDAENYLRTIMESFAIKDPVHWEHVVENSFHMTSDGVYHFSYDPRISHPFRTRGGKQKKLPDINLWKIWELVNCEKILLLRGAESDALLKETAEQMCEKGNVSLIEFLGIGHAPALMEEVQIEIIKDFLSE